MARTTRASVLDETILAESVAVSHRSIDRFAAAHDASHYLLIPQAVATPRTTSDVASVFRAARASGQSITFRSGGTSLSGQAVTAGVLVDTRKHFREVRVGDEGRTVRAQPGATVRQVNAHLARHGRKLGPDPASEIACTIGGVIANNSSGMACGTEQNTYRTLRSLVCVLPSGTVVDTAAPDARTAFAAAEPQISEGLCALRDRLRRSPAREEVARMFAIKNTMGYGLNALLDFDEPLDILAHLIVGSEGTLAFVAEAEFDTVDVLPAVSTGLLVFSDLAAATAALPALVAEGMATIELMDATSLRVAQRGATVPPQIADIEVQSHAALLVELHARSLDALAEREASASALFETLPLAVTPRMTTDGAERAALWLVRKGLYATLAGARPSGTTALLEDIAVPVPQLLPTCERLIELFDVHGYEDAVIFGHAKDGNIHFLLNERFDDPVSVARYERFTEDLVDLVLRRGGTLKAEHGTGRMMAPFVERQYGAELYGMMREVKELIDPDGVLNPGVIIAADPKAHLKNLKRSLTVESEVDRCVECGYCEPSCPSRDVTLTPRQRIVLRREMASAQERGDRALVAELRNAYGYEGVQTCAVDGMCGSACPVGINTGDLVRRLRAESASAPLGAVWGAAAKHWGAGTRAVGAALTVADAVPAPLVRTVTRVGRAVLGADTVPLYTDDIPAGGRRRPRGAASVEGARLLGAPGRPSEARAVFFATCMSTMFAPAPRAGEEELGSTAAFLALAERARVTLVAPDDAASLCCGTPWKSKGYAEGYATMTDRVLSALDAASDGGRLPIVCDAASCTEGLETMQALAAAAGDAAPRLRFVDATTFAAEEFLPALTATHKIGSVAVHQTCATTQLGAAADVDALAAFAAEEVYRPVDWGCCGFAGDRGMLHPELTASATAREAAEVTARAFDAYVSANRACEIGMSRATGRSYTHVLELVEAVSRDS